MDGQDQAWCCFPVLGAITYSHTPRCHQTHRARKKKKQKTYIRCLYKPYVDHTNPWFSHIRPPFRGCGVPSCCHGNGISLWPRQALPCLSDTETSGDDQPQNGYFDGEKWWESTSELGKYHEFWEIQVLVLWTLDAMLLIVFFFFYVCVHKNIRRNSVESLYVSPKLQQVPFQHSLLTPATQRIELNRGFPTMGKYT